jgi:hypothetical protein
MWLVDPDAGIRAYNAELVNGNMTGIPLPVSPNPSKFQRPAFGHGRYYLSTVDGQVLVSLLKLVEQSCDDFRNRPTDSQLLIR